MSTDLNAPITAVTVYTDRARVTRSSEIDLKQGESVLVLSGLPTKMNSDSVRVSGKGAGITIRGVDVKRDVQDGTDNTQWLENQKKQIRQEDYALKFQWQGLEDRIAYYKALKVKASQETGLSLLAGDSTFERSTEIVTYIGEQLDVLYEQQRQLLIKRDEMEERLDTILLQASGENAIQAGQQIHIAVHAESDTPFSYEIEYNIIGAHWKPLYDVRLLDDNQVELTYMAQITQETGEDWNDVQLSLSTARPALSNRLPEAKAWYIHGLRKGERLLGASLQQLRDPELGAASHREMQAKPKAQVQQATISAPASGVVINYNIATPITVSGDGESHKTTITITGLKAELDYVTVPRIAQEAYLRATITNTSEYTILPGEASIFHENDFVGKTQLETISPTEEFQVQLGVDERIKIERELLTRKAETRMIGTVHQVKYRYAVHITNLLQKPTKITVQDQYPLSRDSDVTISLDSVSPEANEENDLHILTWELDLPDDKKRSIELAFTVQHKRNQSLRGLDD